MSNKINLVARLYKNATDGIVGRIFKDVTKITINFIINGGQHFLTRDIEFFNWPGDLNGSTVWMNTMLESSPYYFTPPTGSTSTTTGRGEWSIIGFDDRGILALQCDIKQWARPDYPNANDLTLYYAQFTVGNEVITKVIGNSIGIKAVDNKCNGLFDDITQIRGRLDAQEVLIDTAYKDIANLLSRVNAVEAKVDTYDGRIIQLESTVSTFDARISECLTRVLAVENEVSTYDSRLRQLETTINTFDSRIKSIEDRMSAYDAKFGWVPELRLRPM